MTGARLTLLFQFLCLTLALANAQSGANFGLVNAGTAAPTQTITYAFPTATTLSAVDIVTTGATGLDYRDGGGSTCTAGIAYNVGGTCTVTVAFTPLAPGLRSGAVILFAQGSTLPLITSYLTGVGQSGAITIDPGTQTTIATLNGNGQGYGSVVDGAGNVFVVDHTNNQVIELAAASFTQSMVVASGLSSPTALALDGAGNLYISDTGDSLVVMVPNEQGTLNSADVSTVNISGLGSPQGLATDGGGNLYIADSLNGNVTEVPAGGGAPITVASGLTSPDGLAVDANGNVYVVANNAVSEYQPPFPGTPLAIGSGYNNPGGVAVDASGAVYVADTGNAQIVRVAPGGASQAALAVAGLVGPQSVALDSSDNVYIADSGNVFEVNRTQAAALAFGNTFVGSTSAAQIVTVSNAGNLPLSVLNLTTSTNFAAVPSGGVDCSSNTQLSYAGQCLIGVASDPAISGSFTGTLTLSDNALNNTASTQMVQLSGAGVQVAQTIAFPTIPTQFYGVAPFALSAAASSGLPVSYKVISGPATVSGGTLTITSTGSVTVQASQAGNAEYTSATPFSQTFTVSPEETSVVWTNPVAITYGTALSAKQLDATVTPSSTGTYVYTPISGTVLNAGSQPLSVQFTPSKTVYASSIGSVTLQVNQASQKITFTEKAPASAQYGSSFTVAATAGSELPVVFSSSGVCSNAGDTFTMGNSAGSCTVIANQYGNGNYLAAPAVTETTKTSGKISPTVTFTGAPAKAAYQFSFTVVATSSSGITPTITTTGSCSISGTTVTMTTGTGTCITSASWVGNNTYLAETRTQTTTATQISPTVTFTGAPASAQYQSTFSVAATSNSGVTPTITVTGPCSISGGIVTMNSASGTCATKAAWAANSDYLAKSLTQNTTAQKQATIISWATPAPIDNHTALSETQLDATADVVGTFKYTPAAGQILGVGNHNLTVKFTPFNDNYAASSLIVPLQVTAKACSPTTQTGTSGPPNYGGLRSDPCEVTVGNILSLWTNFPKDYGYTGAGTVVTNSMGLQTLRVTDGNTDPSYPGRSYMNNYSGGDGDQHWTIDHSMFALGRGAAAVTYVYLFNGTTMQATQLQNAGKPFLLPSTLVAFGQTAANAHKVWVLGTSPNCTKTGPCAILQYDLSSCVASPTSCTPPAPTTIYDFQQPASGSSPASCLYGLNVTWYGTFRVSYDDTLFTMGFSNAGIQGTGTIIAGYSVGNGCRVWNTGTSTLNIGPTVGGIPGGYVVGEFPPGAATPQPMTMTGCGNGYNCPGGADQFTVHGADSVPSSLLGHVSSTVCLGGSCCGISGGSCNLNPNPNGEYFWDFATTNAFAFGGTGSLFSGHECVGYTSLVHGVAQGQMGFIGFISPGGAFTPSIVSGGGNNALLVAADDLPLTGSLNLDTHCGWNADNTDDTMPILVSTTTVCLGNQGSQLENACTPPSNKPNNGCVIPADITSSSWPSSGPSCGAGNPFTGPLVNEVLLYQTNSIPGTTGNACVTTNGTTNSYESGGAPPCSQSNILRLGNHGISSLNPNFDAQNATIDWSPDGLFYTVTTDWWCTFGAAVLGQDTVCGGVDWQQNTAYSVGDIITPAVGNTANCTYTASGTPPLISGTAEPTGWGTLTGGICPAQIPATALDGNITWLRVGAIGQQNARYDVIVGSTTTN